MNYQSLNFLMFCAAVLFVYYLFGRKMQKWVLAAANIAFFAISGVKYLPFIIVTTLATYICGLSIGRVYNKADVLLASCETPDQKKAVRKKAKSRAKRRLVFSLIITVGLLIVCKYTEFIFTNVNSALNLFKLPQIEMFKFVLPIGISFYTFMAISYVLDIFWKRYKPEKNIITYWVFVSYFPHVVQGPIDRFNEFKEQIADGVKLSYQNLTYGAQLAMWGFFKKLVIADRIGAFVNEFIDNYENYDGILIILALLVYSIQIYCDFSGCIDIISGISEMFGIKLRKNFFHPYFSKNMAEFWRRWHISLQEWFKDYIYFPVSSSKFVKNVKKKKKLKGKENAGNLFASCFPIFVVWCITGLWHGAAWKFFAWGMFHAALLILSQIFAPSLEKLTKFLHIKTENFSWGLFQMLRTYLLCCIGRIFFRAPSFRDSFYIIKNIVLNTHVKTLFSFSFSSLGFDKKFMILSVLFCLALLLVDILQEKFDVREALAKQNIWFRWIIFFICLFAIIIYGVYGPDTSASSFIYEQF